MASKAKTDEPVAGSEDASVNAGLDLQEGDSIDGVGNVHGEQTDGHVEPTTSGASNVGLATHDAHGGTLDEQGSVTLSPAEVLSGVSAEQTETSLRDRHTADSLAPGSNAELAPGIEARLIGHGPDAQHRFSGHHDPDVDSPEHEWRTANVPMEACICGALRAAPL